MIIEQVIDLRIWKLEIKDISLRSSYGCLVNSTVDNHFQWQIVKNCFELKVLSAVNSVWLDCECGFHWQTLLFIFSFFYLQQFWTFWLWCIKIHFRDCFQAFAHHHLECLCYSIAIWLDTHFLEQSVNFDLLLCTGFDWEHMILFQCLVFTQRPMNDGKLVPNNEHCFGL